MTGGRKYFFRGNPDDRTTEQILGYLKDFGHGEATIERDGGFRKQFGGLTDTWADLTK